MNECVICGKECQGMCCSGACRARKSRRTNMNQGARSEAHAEQIKADDQPKPRAKDPKLLETLGTGKGIPNFGQPNCQCKQCQAYRIAKKDISLLNHGPYKQANHLGEGEANRVSLPGDQDYEGIGAC